MGEVEEDGGFEEFLLFEDIFRVGKITALFFFSKFFVFNPWFGES